MSKNTIASTPRETPIETLKLTQNLILSSLEEMMPPTFDLNYVTTIFQSILGINPFLSDQEIPVTFQALSELNYQLLQFFVSAVRQNFIDFSIYQGLQQQTQRAEATIRSHIKIQHQMKMYMDYVQAKLQKFQKSLSYRNQYSDDWLRKQINILTQKQLIYQNEKINLIKSNEKLKMQVEKLKKKLNRTSQTTTQKVNQKLLNLIQKYDLQDYKLQNNSIKYLPPDTYKEQSLPETDQKCYIIDDINLQENKKTLKKTRMTYL